MQTSNSPLEPDKLRNVPTDNGSLAPSGPEDTATTQAVLTFDDNRRASVLFGQYGQNLALIERKLGVVADSRGNQVTIEGSRDACERARRVLEGLYEQVKRGHDLTQGDVEGAIRLAIAQGSLFDFDPATSRAAFEEINLRKRPVRARTGRLRRLICSKPEREVAGSKSNSEPWAMARRIAPSTSPGARSRPRLR